MMETPAFMPYDSRNTHMQRPLPQQYVVGPPYNSASIPNSGPPPPHSYPSQQSFAYVSYQSSPPSTPIGSPFKHDAHQRPAPSGQRMPAPHDDGPRHIPFRRGSKSISETRRRQSPSTRSESVSTTSRSVMSNPTANSKTITYNETIDPADRIDFGTDVDELMKVIQTNEEGEEDVPARAQAPTPAHTPVSEPASVQKSPARQPTPARCETKSKKKWVCDGPSCRKRFVQKTHLDIHRRTHTGLKPYVCTKDNCGLTFSQRGNLKTHMRRHTGEKPFSCSICGKLFAQRGNVRSHEETHKGLKPFICRLDDCHKTFSQLGNMKTHQNNFHKETLQRLTTMFIRCAQMGQVPDEHQELFEYFKAHYKNSNKGIKGRGKARTVAPKVPKGESHANQQQQQQQQQQQYQQQHQQQQQPQQQQQQQQQQNQQQQNQQQQNQQQQSQQQPQSQQPHHQHHHHHQPQHPQQPQPQPQPQHQQQPPHQSQPQQQQHTPPQQPPPPSSLAFPHHLPMPNPQQPPHHSYVPGPAGPMTSIPRHSHQHHHHHHHHHPSMYDGPQHPPTTSNGAAGMLYEDEHARQMAFTDRLYQ